MGILSFDFDAEYEQDEHKACHLRQKKALNALEDKFRHKIGSLSQENSFMRDRILQLELNNGLSMAQIRAIYPQWFKV
jgi:hypothetical protein